jgi:magnesium transporter
MTRENRDILIERIHEQIDAVIKQDSDEGRLLWNAVTSLHPADISELFSHIGPDERNLLFSTFPDPLKIEVFLYFSDTLKASALEHANDQLKTKLLESMSLDDFTDIIDLIDPEDLKKYFKLMHKKDRELVLELLKFDPESAGGVMDINIISLSKDLTVQKSIHVLQKLEPQKELHEIIYVTDKNNTLLGHIKIEDLVFKSSDLLLSEILRENEYVAIVDQDQETVAQKMMHYHLSIVPVTDNHGNFLGVIPSETLVEIIEKEGAEDIYRISALEPLKHTYFETPFFRLFSQRSIILVVLLLVESLSTYIMQSHEATLPIWILTFLTMLMSIGGNTSGQTSTVVIQGLASGEINNSNIKRFLRREFVMACALAITLGIVAFLRAYVHLENYRLAGSVAIGLTAMAIAISSVVLGSILPLILKKIGGDPAYLAGPSLATIMDVLGVIFFCYIVKMVVLWASIPSCVCP